MSGAAQRLRVGMIGAGAVATALTRALARTADVRVWARRREASVRLSKSVGAAATAALTLTELADCEVILVAVSDDAITEVATRLRGAAALHDAVVLHTSGRWTGAEALAPIAESAVVGSVHPLVAVARQEAASFAGMPFAVEASDPLGRGFAALLVRAVGGRVLALPPGPDVKLRYHALATMVATGVVALVDQAAHGVGAKNATEVQALREAYAQLALSAANNVRRGSGPDVLTGALARGDEATVEAHRHALANAADLYGAVESSARSMLARQKEARPVPVAAASEADVAQASDAALPREPLPGPLVVSLVAPSMDAFAEALATGAATGADVVELRLDHVAAACRERPSLLRDLIARIPVPVAVAIHGDEGFGTFRGTSGERTGLLRLAAECGATFVDVDERYAEELGDLPVRRILSTHVNARSIAELNSMAQRLDSLARPGVDLIKIVPHAGSVAFAFELLRWLRSRPSGSTIAFASGEVGAFSRLLAPAYGSALVYAAPPTDVSGDLEPAAPGQWPVPHVRAIWPADGKAPSGDTHIAAVVGQPIAHSAGPVVHGAALRAAGLDGMLVPIAPERLGEVPIAAGSDAATGNGAAAGNDAAAGRDAAAGSNTAAGDDAAAGNDADPRWCGLSVTAPFKLDAHAAATTRDEAATAIGAANTLTRGADGALVASNTDAPAVRSALEEAGAALRGASALVIGAGGAARAAVAALASAGAWVTVAARREEAAAELCALDLPASAEAPQAVALGTPAWDALRPDVIVHTTPLGTDGEGVVPIGDEALAGTHVLDAVYRPRVTELLERTRRAGGVPIEGSRWFLDQAWLQHLALFQALYASRFGAEGPPADVVAAGRAAMAAALDRWLAGTIGVVSTTPEAKP